MRTLRALFLSASVASGAATWAAEPLGMELRNAFEGRLNDTSAVTVELSNDGPDAQGVVRLSGDSDDMSYPVELPQGARKRLLTLPRSQWGELRYSLETNRGNLVRKLNAEGYRNDQIGTVLSVGADSGNLAFVRGDGGGNKPLRALDAYVTPENAPDRPAAYDHFSSIFLGKGSERMPDAAVNALTDYALGGGTLVFVGGASAPVLDDRRWASVLPGTGWEPKTLSVSATLAKSGGASFTGVYTVLQPAELARDANVVREGSTPIVSERALGLGHVVVLGYSPFELPLNAWAGRGKAIGVYARSREGGVSRSFVTNAMGGSSTGAPPTGPAGSDPFGTKLPPTGTVFGLLIGYFVLVVPVSFFVLRKLKRAEWAWFTAPLLSLGFAGLLFKSASGLYASALSTSTRGVLVLQQGVPRAMFYGTTEMFFPRGGVYDLKLSGVDSLMPVSDGRYSYRRDDSLAGFNPLDVGEVVVPRLEANNLSFRELSLAQRIDAPDWVRIDREDADCVRVTNGSPYRLKGSVVSDQAMSAVIDLEPGSSSAVTLDKGDQVQPGASLAAGDPRTFTRGTHRLAFSGVVSGFRPGSQIGNEVPGRGRINVLAFGREIAR